VSSHASAHHADSSAPARPCQNCGALLAGPYCSNCGQHDVDYHRSFHHLFHDILENLFHFEGKFFVTVAWLLAKPGRLTREFVAGRRQSQLNPLRLYLFVSVLFFLGLSLLNHGHVFDFDRRQVDQLAVNLESGVKLAEKFRRELTPAQLERAGQLIGETIDERGTPPDEKTIAGIIDRVRQESSPTPALSAANGNPSTPQPGQPKLHTKLTIDRTTDFGRALDEKLRSGELSLSAILDDLEHRIPTLLFLGVPLFALLLKLAYVRSGRFYIEHLIFSLHLHTWLFLAFMLGNGYLKLAALGANWLATLGAWALGLWMAWYIATAFRAVYAQGWRRTVLKIALLGAAYGVLLVATALLLITLTVYWLAME